MIRLLHLLRPLIPAVLVTSAVAAASSQASANVQTVASAADIAAYLNRYEEDYVQKYGGEEPLETAGHGGQHVPQRGGRAPARLAGGVRPGRPPPRASR